jgi:hypothetical protein
MARRLLLFWLALGACVGCGPTDVGVDNQAYCAALANAVCARGDACGTTSRLPQAPPTCESGFAASCCSATTCPRASGLTRSQIDTCVADVANYDCMLLGAGGLPRTCPALPSSLADAPGPR